MYCLLFACVLKNICVLRFWLDQVANYKFSIWVSVFCILTWLRNYANAGNLMRNHQWKHRNWLMFNRFRFLQLSQKQMAETFATKLKKLFVLDVVATIPFLDNSYVTSIIRTCIRQNIIITKLMVIKLMRRKTSLFSNWLWVCIEKERTPHDCGNFRLFHSPRNSS